MGISGVAGKQLTRDISTCETAGVLLDLVELRLDDLDAIHIAAIFSRFSVLSKSTPTPETDARFVRLLAISQVKMEVMETRALSAFWTACGKMRLLLSPDWMATFWSTVRQRIFDFEPRGYAELLNACARLHVMPPPELMPAFWQASKAQMASANPQVLSNTVHACGRLSMMLPDDWLAAFWPASKLLLVSCTERDLSSMLHGLAVCHVIPPAEWMAQFWARAERLALGDGGMRFTDQHLSVLRNACSILKLPPPAWLRA